MPRDPNDVTAPGSYSTGPLLCGPMAGEAGEHDARVWAQARDESPLTLTLYRSAGEPSRLTVVPRLDDGLCVVFTATGLSQDEACEYTIESVHGVTDRYPLRAAPPKDARRLRIVFGSCFWDYGKAGPILNAMSAERAGACVMLGDNCYFDNDDLASEDAMLRAQLRSRNNSAMRRLVSSVSTLAIWDDHDYGDNNSDGTFEGKDMALRTFRRVWAQRSYGKPDIPGVFESVRMGPVEMFLTDGRYHRVELTSTLGKEQLEWLKSSLLASDAPVKVVVSGTQMFTHVPAARDYECWRRDGAAELAALVAFIDDNDIRGVVFLSGDIHIGYLIHPPRRSLPGGRIGADIWEVTSSPLAHPPWHDPIIVWDDYDPTLITEVVDNNYGVVDVDLDRGGKEIVLSLRDPGGVTTAEQAIALSSLSSRAAPRGLDAVMRTGDQVLFFAGDRCATWDSQKGAVVSCRPRQEAWQGELDTALVWPNGRAYRFDHNGYVALDARSRQPFSGYPRYVARGFTGLWPYGIDAALVWDDAKAYFFRGREYMSYDIAADRVDEGYPRPLEETWPGVVAALGID